MNAREKQSESQLMADTLNGSPHGETVVLYSVLDRICEAIEAQTKTLNDLSDHLGEGMKHGNAHLSRLADEASSIASIDAGVARSLPKLEGIKEGLSHIADEISGLSGVEQVLEHIQKSVLLISRWPKAHIDD